MVNKDEYKKQHQSAVPYVRVLVEIHYSDNMIQSH